MGAVLMALVSTLISQTTRVRRATGESLTTKANPVLFESTAIARQLLYLLPQVVVVSTDPTPVV
jgi:hypothetical protein